MFTLPMGRGGGKQGNCPRGMLHEGTPKICICAPSTQAAERLCKFFESPSRRQLDYANFGSALVWTHFLGQLSSQANRTGKLKIENGGSGRKNFFKLNLKKNFRWVFL